MFINTIIDLAIKKRGIILFCILILTLLGIQSAKHTPLDALPDLSDVQVIIKSTYSGQDPSIIEEQVTYPISLAMLSVPKAKTVRAFSYFGDSYVYVIFDDKTDIYWARSRVLEYLNQVKDTLPIGTTSSLGADASGVGWIYQYALVDKTGQHHLGELKSIQDWYLKTELESVTGVAEVATVGGMENTYQVIVDPVKILRYELDLKSIIDTINENNASIGGSVIEMAEAEYMIRTKGHLKTLDDFKKIPLKTTSKGSVVRLGDIATIRKGASLRRGIAELNGNGEVTGGIVIMRHGDNAMKTITQVKEKLRTLSHGLPQGVEIVTTYDRSKLITKSVDNLFEKVIDEILIIGIVCFIFLVQLRSALVAIIVIPVSLSISFLLMNYANISANIMSLGGIAIAIGAVVDGAIVMLDNYHNKLARFNHDHEKVPDDTQKWTLVSQAAKEVGAPVFFSLIIITLSFLPVFSLEAQEGKLFTPLAFTKTIIMLVSAMLTITFIPVIMGYLVKNKTNDKKSDRINTALIFLYKPLLNRVLRFPKTSLLLCCLLLGSVVFPLSQLGSEFMPELEEGDLLYMPTTMASISAGKAGELLQQTNRLIKTVPEVDIAFGKIGRAETATDPAPLTMIETTITLKDKALWREGYTLKDIIRDLDNAVQIPSLTNTWVQPIKTRIDMLSTGIKTPIGIKIMGADTGTLESIAIDIANSLNKIAETKNAYAERSAHARFIDITPKKETYGKYNLSVKDINTVVNNAIGGAKIGEVILDDQRYPITVRYPIETRDHMEKLRSIPLITKNGQYLALSELADINISEGNAMYKSENGRLVSWVYINIDNISVGEYIKKAKIQLSKDITLPARYSYSFAGQFEYMERAKDKLSQMIPLVLSIIFIILVITFNNTKQAMIIMTTLPFALIGSIWTIYALNYHFSVAIAIGMIALSGVAIEFSVLMMVYLNNAFKGAVPKSQAEINALIIDGAVMRIRPKAMTVLTIFLGLLPIMWGSGVGNEIMQKIAAPMIGGMITAPLLSLFILPVMYMYYQRSALRQRESHTK
jgi:Cu(I)/Ag(I) efflux system membrane protein CusA/SilA